MLILIQAKYNQTFKMTVLLDSLVDYMILTLQIMVI
jgi:hypothetical protein